AENTVIMLPKDVATRETLEFLESARDPATIDILEVGCGRGNLAQAIKDRGGRILGLDVAGPAVAATREKGVEAEHIDFHLYQTDRRFDVIAFTRSFHHIQPLNAALQRAKSLLKPGGLIILEDFAAETMDEPTLSWMRKVECELERAVRALEEDHGHRFP